MDEGVGADVIAGVTAALRRQLAHLLFFLLFFFSAMNTNKMQEYDVPDDPY